MDSAVTIRGLTKRFARNTALQDVSFDIPEHSLFGLLGPNGAGKTTLFSIAAGFLKATSGTINVLGVDVRQISELRGRLSMLPQDAAFQSGIPVIDQLIMFARLNGYDMDEAKKRSLHALELVGLAEVAKRNARALSHGMMKRVRLCQAFLGDPEVIFLDEPTSGLDPENARRMRKLIQELKESRTIVISSHNLREIQDICDHVAILNEGKLVACDTMEALTSSTFMVRIKLGGALTEAAERDLVALPAVAKLDRTSDNEFNLELDLESEAAKDEALAAINKTLVGEHNLVPRSMQEGESLEVKFLEIVGGEYDGAGGT